MTTYYTHLLLRINFSTTHHDGALQNFFTSLLTSYEVTRRKRICCLLQGCNWRKVNFFNPAVDARARLQRPNNFIVHELSNETSEQKLIFFHYCYKRFHKLDLKSLQAPQSKTHIFNRNLFYFKFELKPISP